MAMDEFNSFRYESIIIYFQVISKAYITAKANSRKHTKKKKATQKKSFASSKISLQHQLISNGTFFQSITGHSLRHISQIPSK